MVLGERKLFQGIRQGAENGNSFAQVLMGCFYLNPLEKHHNYQSAAEWFKLSAEQGDKRGQYHLGKCYYYSQGVQRDYEKAVYWFQKAADQAEPNAIYELAQCCSHGEGVIACEATARRYYQFAVNAGINTAVISLIALDELARFANLSSDAQNALTVTYEQGLKHYYGNGINRDFAAAIGCWMQAVALPQAKFMLALCYDKGYAVPLDLLKAAEWYRLAAEQQHPQAMYCLGIYYYYGYGLVQDIDEAVRWLRRAAAQGNMEAMWMLGDFYYGIRTTCRVIDYDTPRIATPDYHEANSWYSQAADLGDAYGQYAIGRSYLKGHGLEKDPEQAIFWLRHAAEQQHPDAQYLLGMIYYRGIGRDIDHKVAYYWWQQATLQSHPVAMYKLGNLYEKGLGVKVNLAEALKCYQRAAECNILRAGIALNRILEKLENPERTPFILGSEDD